MTPQSKSLYLRTAFETVFAIRERWPQSPLPLAGRGLGVGVSAPSRTLCTPTPGPSPQGGGEARFSQGFS